MTFVIGSVALALGTLACGEEASSKNPSSAGEAGTMTGGTGGATTGGQSTGGSCPPGSESMMPTLTGMPTQVTAVPPADGYSPFNIEGPVWIDGALYLSQISGAQNPPPSRILEYTPGGGAQVWKDDAGTNGLAVDDNGVLYGASHKDGSISRFDLSNPAAAPVPIVNMYMGTRFSSPNDLTIRSDGIVYFTDPPYQAPRNERQPEDRAYWFDLANPSLITVIDGTSGTPNGISLSPDERTLYVAGSDPIIALPVNADGSLGAGSTFANVSGVDGMGVDCAGNLYAAVNADGDVVVLSPAGTELGRLSVGEGVTNVAFGGPDRTTLYITRLNPPELYEVNVGIAGYPY